MKHKLIFLALNEFNPTLLSSISKVFPGNNYLRKIFDHNSFSLDIKDEYDSGFLEPWSQWVGIHVAQPTAKHRIKNLGDIPKIEYKQVWELLSKKGKSSIIWGSMNASLGSSEKCKAFIPDPWVFTEDPVPKDLLPFIALPRYLARNYTSLSKIVILKNLFKFLKATIYHVGYVTFFRSVYILLKGLIRFGNKNFIYINFFDYVASHLFIKKVKENKSDLNFIFLNSIAHVQHHYWYSSDATKLKEILFTYENIENILSAMDRELAIFKKKNSFVLFNGLSQCPTFNDEPWYLYRIRDLREFMINFDIKFKSIEPLMSYDAHIFFKSKDEMKKGFEILKNIKVSNSNFLYLEPHFDELKIFFRVDITHDVDNNRYLEYEKIKVKFDKYVERIVRRTGKHIQSSTAYHNLDILEKVQTKNKFNYDIFKLIYPDLFKDGSK